MSKRKESHERKDETLKILDKTPFGMLVCDAKGITIHVNQEFSSITGYGVHDLPTLDSFFEKLFPYGDSQINRIDELKRSVKQSARFKMASSLKCKDGVIRHVECIFDRLEDGRMIVWLLDMTQVKKMEMDLMQSERKFRSIFESSKDAIYIASYDGRFVDVNQAFCEMFGEKKEEILKKNAKDAYVLESEKIKLKRALKKDGYVKDFEIRLKKVTGEIMDCLLTVTAIRDESGRIIEYQGIVRDITDRKKAEEKIRYMAFHDMLTGLPNRSLFNDRLQMAMSYAKRAGEMVAIMVLDLDRFKEINDTYGHGLGDEVLKEVAKRLKSVVRRTDTIARMGGDEFLGIFTDIKRVEDIKIVAEKILAVFEKNLMVEGKSFSITASMGFSIYPIHGEDTESLLSKADVAMYEVKQKGRRGFRIYDRK